MSNRERSIKRYSGGHTHPAFDSSSRVTNGTVVVMHSVFKREGAILSALGTDRLTINDLTARLNERHGGGFNTNHVRHALVRLHEGHGARALVHYQDGLWFLSDTLKRIVAMHKSQPRAISTPRV